MHAWTASNSPLNFHRQADFIPERWLSPSTMDPASPFRRDNRAASQPFSVGPRNCLGKAFALNEMRVILARMLWNFDMKLLPQSDGWERQRIFTLWDKGPLMVELNEVRSSLHNQLFLQVCMVVCMVVHQSRSLQRAVHSSGPARNLTG